MNPNGSFFDVLFGWRRLILRIVVVAGLVSAIVSLLLPRWWTAHAVITPPEEAEMGGGLLQIVSQLGGIGGNRTKGLLGRTASVDLVLGVIKSRRLRGQVVDRFDLTEVYDQKSREHAIRELGKHVVANTTPEGLIDIGVEARDPKLAADMANALVEFLDQYNRSTSVEDARRTVEFVQTCLAENRGRMDDAANALRRFQEERGAVELGEQTRATVEALAELEAERTQLEIQKGVLARYATPDQMQMQEIEARIRQIDVKASSLRTKGEPGGKVIARDTALLALGDLPALGLEFAQLKREVLVQEKVYEFLTAQLEEARIRESRDMRTVRVLDEAVPPIRRSRPRRTLVVLLTVGLAFTGALGIAFAAEGIRGLGATRRGETDAWLLRVFGAADALRRWGGPADRGN